ncbi:right-handed parallel beta-helix repeat-containing protein [Micromonospora sp. NBC_00421]|uniref:right-handed parallel beta-helix repeat-containing protein n=1 Tax=Micromonospora sp. NBC_00421 TaxID=2975976 RepID=UPI002E2351FC
MPFTPKVWSSTRYKATTDELNRMETALATASTDAATAVAIVGATSYRSLNVRSWGATGDDVTDDAPAFQAAINAAVQGDVVVVPPGRYRLASPITLTLGVTLQGAGWAPHFAPRTNMIGSFLRPATGGAFVGTTLIQVNPAPVNDSYLDSAYGGGPRIEGLAVSGRNATNSVGGTIAGISVASGVKDIGIRDTTIWQMSGVGVDMDRAAGIKMRNVVVSHCGGNGVRLWDSTGGSSGAVDADLVEVYVQGSGGDGILLNNPNAVMLTNCRSEWTTGYGYVVSGTCYNLVITACDTDRSGKDGFLLAHTAGSPVLLTNCLAKRDGRGDNITPGGWAGFRIAPASGTGPGAILNGCYADVARDDNSSGLRSPEYGLYAGAGANRVSIAGGHYLGTTAAIQDTALVVARAPGTNLGTVNVSTGAITMSTSDRAVIVGNQGAAREVLFSTRGGGIRWATRATGTSESGSNAGSDFAVVRHSDAGAELDSPLTISRATGDTVLGASLDVVAQALGLPTPRSVGLAAWSFDPANVAQGKTTTSGTVYLVAVYVPRSVSVTKIMWGNFTAGATPTAGQNFVGLYNSTGTLLVSAGVDADVTTTGMRTTTVSSTAVTPGRHWVGFVFNATTPPAPYRGGDLNATLHNAGAAGSTTRFATNGTSQTSLPASITTSSNTPSQHVLWAGIG